MELVWWRQFESYVGWKSKPTIELPEALVVETPATPDSGVPIYFSDDRGWHLFGHKPRRPKESLILPDDTMDDILGDLRRFLDSAEWYAANGVPYHRGVMLTGPAGTGKTSLVGILAGELGLSIASLSLGQPGLDDSVLRSLVRNLDDGDLLLMEDVDCAGLSRDGDAPGVTFSGLLNVLDGLGSRLGQIVIMTTNHPDRLDPALIRPGRVDRRLEFGYATRGTAARMFEWFYRDHANPEMISSFAQKFAGTIIEGSRIAPARIQEHLLRFRDQPEKAYYSALTSGIVYESREPMPAQQRGAVYLPMGPPIQSQASNGDPQAEAAVEMLRRQIEQMRNMTS